MQPECHLVWLLLGVCTYPLYMTLLRCEISLMHRPLHIMCLVCVQDHSPGLITMPPRMWSAYATPQPWHVLIPWSPYHVISHPSHLAMLAFSIRIIISMQVPCKFLESIARNTHIYQSLPCWLFLIVPLITSSSFSTSSLPWFFKTLKESPKIYGKIFLV
jgi:hypothetical protein